MKKYTVLIFLLITTSPLFAEIQFGSQFGYNFTFSKTFKKIDSSKPADYKFGTGGFSGGFELWYGKKYMWIGLDVFHTPQYELGYDGNMKDYLSYLILSPQFKITTKSGFYGGINLGLANRFKNNYLRNADGQVFSTGIFIGYSFDISSHFRTGFHLRSVFIFEERIIYNVSPAICLNYTY